MYNLNIKNIKKHTTPFHLSYPKERWKLINETKKHYISTFGRVYSVNKDKILSTFIQNAGYVSVTLRNKGEKKNYTVHRLVARYFIPNPNNYNEIDHIDNNKFNNYIDNLQWCSHRYNSAKRDKSYIILYDEEKHKLGLYYSIPHLAEHINISVNSIWHKLRKIKNNDLLEIVDYSNNTKYYIKKLK